MASAPERIAIGLLLAAWAAASGTAAGPPVEPLVGRVDTPGGGLALAAPLPHGVAGPDERSGAFLIGETADTNLVWLGQSGKPTVFDQARPATGKAVAAHGLSASTLAVVTVDDDADEGGAGGGERVGARRLVFLRRGESGRFELAGLLALPAADADDRWSLAATPTHLFVGVGGRLFRCLHTQGGVAQPKVFAALDRRVASLAIGPKGYLVALVADAVADADGARELLFFNPSAPGSAPVAAFTLPLAGAEAIAYGSARDEPSPGLYAVSGNTLHRIGLAAGADGRLEADPRRVWSTDGPIRSLTGVAAWPAASPLLAAVGDELFKITPQPTE